MKTLKKRYFRVILTLPENKKKEKNKTEYIINTLS